jgi:hypothetical protein
LRFHISVLPVLIYRQAERGKFSCESGDFRMQDWGSLTSAHLESSFLPFRPHLVSVAAWKVIHVSTKISAPELGSVPPVPNIRLSVFRSAYRNDFVQRGQI